MKILSVIHSCLKHTDNPTLLFINRKLDGKKRNYVNGRSLDTEELSFVERCATYISYPCFLSANKQFETFLLLTDVPKVCVSCLKSVTIIRGWAPDWNHRTFGEWTFILVMIIVDDHYSNNSLKV